MAKLAEVGDIVEVRYGTDRETQYIMGTLIYIPAQVGDYWAIEGSSGTVYQFVNYVYIKILKKG